MWKHLDPNGLEKILKGAVLSNVPAARVKRTANSSNLTASTFNAVTWTTFDHNVGNQWDSVTNPSRLTAKIPGKYLITAGVTVTSPNALDRHLAFRKNGSTYVARIRYESPGTDVNEMNLTTVLDLNATDYVESMIFPGTDTTCQVYFEADWTPHMTMTYLGPGIMSEGPSQELAYVETTADVSVTSTTGQTVLTLPTLTFDGNTTAMIEFWTRVAEPPNAAGGYIGWRLLDNGSNTGTGDVLVKTDTATTWTPASLRKRIKPIAGSHVYSISAFVSSGTGTLYSGTSTTMFMRMVTA